MFEAITSNPEIYLENITLLSYLAVFLGGVMISFTPCVYPLIPVTAAFIGATSEAGRARGFILSFFYVLGIATIYSCLGAIAALGGRLFGEVSSSPWTYLIVGNIFLLLGLSMLGVFDFPLVRFYQDKGMTGKRPGAAGAFIIGIFSGLVIGPCLTPALGAILAYVASRQNLFLGVSLLFTFALGMGILLIVVGTFTGLAASLPRSGRWMNIIKKIFGFLLILCAEYFIISAGKRF
jgi:thiol:disulfide interchange protein DsbD